MPKYSKRRRFSRTRRKGRGRRGFRRAFRGRKFSSTKKITKVRLGRNTLPDEAWVKMKWNYFANFTNAGSGASGLVQLFRGNSLFDPDATGVGTQPLTFDQWCPGLYTTYYVAASKIKIDLWSTSANQEGMLLTLLPTINQYTTATILTKPISQQPYAWTKPLLYSLSGSGNRQKMKYYMTTNKIWGQRDTEGTSAFSSLYNVNPGNPWFWNVILQSVTGTNNVCQANGIITITYYSKLYNRAAIDAS